MAHAEITTAPELKAPITTHSFRWRDIDIEIRHEPDACGGLDEIEISTIGDVPFPLSETGYLSDFRAAQSLDGYADVREFVEAWIEQASQSREWLDYEQGNQQLMLF